MWIEIAIPTVEKERIAAPNRKKKRKSRRLVSPRLPFPTGHWALGWTDKLSSAGRPRYLLACPVDGALVAVCFPSPEDENCTLQPEIGNCIAVCVNLDLV